MGSNNINVFYNFNFSSSELEKEVKRHESQLSDLEEQQKKILANVRKDTNNLEMQRQGVIRELEKVKTRDITT